MNIPRSVPAAASRAVSPGRQDAFAADRGQSKTEIIEIGQCRFPFERPERSLEIIEGRDQLRLRGLSSQANQNVNRFRSSRLERARFVVMSIRFSLRLTSTFRRRSPFPLALVLPQFIGILVHWRNLLWMPITPQLFCAVSTEDGPDIYPDKSPCSQRETTG